MSSGDAVGAVRPVGSTNGGRSIGSGGVTAPLTREQFSEALQRRRERPVTPEELREALEGMTAAAPAEGPFERADLAMNYNVKVLPRHRLYLEHEDGTDAARLVRLFGETWRRLPLYVRRALLGYWRRPPHWPAGVALPDSFEGCMFAKVRLVRTLGQCTVYGDELAAPLDAMGCCSSDGRLVRFADAWCALFSDEAVRVLVAHELCHAFFRARGWYDDDPWDEEHADLEARLEGWGFDEELLSYEVHCAHAAGTAPTHRVRSEAA